MKWDDFKNFTKELEGKFKFTGGVDDNQIVTFEQSIGIEFPDDYRSYLRDFGSCRVTGCSFLGIGKKEFNTAKECYDDYLSLGLPRNFIPLQNYGEFLYCLKVDEDGYAVVYWSPEGGSKDLDTTLAAFIKDEFSEALEI